MHVRRSRVRVDRVATATSVAWWPDLVLWHPTRRFFIARELKTNAGRLTAEQRQVLDELAACGVDVAVWRPSDWDVIERTLVTARRLT